MSLGIIFFILTIHWFADFVCQSDKMAKGKSTSFGILLNHTAIYSLVWVIALVNYGIIIAAPIVFVKFVIKFAFITFIAHTVIDYYTSKTHTILWEKKKVHAFFVSIGFDQVLHYVQLFLTFELLK